MRNDGSKGGDGPGLEGPTERAYRIWTAGGQKDSREKEYGRDHRSILERRSGGATARTVATASRRRHTRKALEAARAGIAIAGHIGDAVGAAAVARSERAAVASGVLTSDIR